MNIVPPPRSSYVRVKLLGAAPDSYFDVCGFSFQTPTNASRAVGAVAAGRVVGRDVVVAAGFGLGRGGFCWASESPDDRIVNIARDGSNRRRVSSMNSLQQPGLCMCRAGSR